MNSFELNDCGQGKTRPGIKWIINIPQSPAPACDVRNEEGNAEYLTSPTWRAANHFLIDIS